MVANRKTFEKSMKKAADYARSKAWAKAIKEYKWALTEFPDDPQCLCGLGIAYAESNQLQPAQDLFRGLMARTTDDPTILGYLADIDERLGETDQAAELAMKLGNQLQSQGKLREAIAAWSRAARLQPNLDEPHYQLAAAFISLAENENASASQVNLAQAMRAKGRHREAGQALQLALRLNPGNLEARSMRESMRAVDGGEGAQPETDSGPIDMARQAAWAELAQVLFDDMAPEMLSDTEMVPAESRYKIAGAGSLRLDRPQINSVLGRAVDLDSQGNVEGAMAAYQQVLRGAVDRVAVHFALGLLHRMRGDLEEACAHLAGTAFHPAYALAAHLALGDCYEQHARMDLAVQHYVQALKVADLRTVDESRALDVAALYGSLTDGYRYEGYRGREAAINRFVESVKDFFRDRHWLTRAQQLRQHLDALSLDGTTMSLAEGLGVPGFEEILGSLNEVQHLVNRGLLMAAREECYRAVERAPGYLPLHLRLADIFIRQGMIEDAVSKYLMVAQVYEVWRDYAQAINVYRQILSLTPLDVKVRSTLIDLLINRREIDQAVEEYLALADAYYQQARVDKALEKFNEALRLCSRSQSEQAWRLKILYFIGDLHAQRVDWKKAIETYQQILQLSPEEDQASLALLDLFFKQNLPEQALAELQRLIKRHEADKDGVGLLRVLREAARLRPNEMSIRARLSQVYIERGMRLEAIAELDALGEMQLEAGLRDQAIQTIRLIVSLKPANSRAYKQLLYHLLS